MSRSGYSDDIDDHWAFICWRGAVASALRGKRGQAFVKEMLAAFDRLEHQRLISGELEQEGEVCALGAVGKTRGMDMSEIDPDDHEGIAGTFGIPHALACEIMFQNDEAGPWKETPEDRYARVRRWLEWNIKPGDGRGPSPTSDRL
jgi:hypothetical protein